MRPFAFRLFPFAWLVIAIAVQAGAQQPLRIGKVTVRALDVYSQEEAQRGAAYRLADRLHIETRQSVIRRFLLFSEGEVYRPERLAETERNLRALSFLKAASVIASPPHDGLLDVTVTTQDAWSIAPETQAGMKGGSATYGASFSDTNLLGYGKNVELGWDKGVDRTRFAVNYNDPAFFAPYWRAHFGYAITSDGYDHRFSVGRPFYSFATPWATEFSFTGFRQNDRLFHQGVETERFRQKHDELTAAYGVALDPNDQLANRITGGVRWINDDFGTLPGHPPAGLATHREFRYLFLRLDRAENDYVKVNFVNKDLRYEDFNLGTRTLFEAAVSPKALGVDSTTGFVRFAAANGSRRFRDSFFMPSVQFSTRLNGGVENATASGSAFYVKRTGTAFPQALVGRVLVNAGWRLDREAQFFADGGSGLRGYRLHAFAGSRSIVFNLEERVYLGREVLQVVSPAIVVFVDSGNATYRGFSDLMALKTDVGVGIRLGMPRTPKNLLRIDLAYALNRDPLGRRGWTVSFSSGQAF
jgi:outer membrane protein assembly factor BamA